MVAFGWRLYSSRNPGWEDHYVDYAALKTRIKTIQRQEREGLRDVAVNENALLLEKLAKDLENVSAFWDERCERYEGEFEDIKQRVAEMHAATDRGSPMGRDPSPVPSGKDGGEAVFPSTSPFRSVFEEEQRETALLKEFTLLRAQLERLDAFQKLNEEAVRKIIKKHNKQNPFFAGESV